jgi:hypothetical protein
VFSSKGEQPQYAQKPGTKTTRGPYHSLVRVTVVNLIMQLTVHVQVHIEVADTFKEQLTKVYKQTHSICELWMLSTFISNSYTNK